MNTNSLLTKDYDSELRRRLQKNKPKTNPISKKLKMNATLFITRHYEDQCLRTPPENKSKQTQFQGPTCPHRSRHLRIDRMNRKDHWCLECFFSHWLAHFSACEGVFRTPSNWAMYISSLNWPTAGPAHPVSLLRRWCIKIGITMKATSTGRAQRHKVKGNFTEIANATQRWPQRKTMWL